MQPERASRVNAPPESRAAKPEVVGIGVIVRDLTVLVDESPGPDQKVTARAFRESGGGPVPTALVALAGWGRSVALAGVVGDDPSGRFVIDELRASGVDTGCAVAEPGTETPVSVITVAPPRRAICEVGQGPREAPRGLLERLAGKLEACRFLLVDGRFPGLQRAAAERVRSSGGRVMLDVGRPREGLDELLGAVDIALVSSSFCGRNGWPAEPERLLAELADRLAADGPGIAGATLGSRGCVVRRDGATRRIPAYLVDVLDSTGAGDIFHAGAIEGLLSGEGVDEALRFGCAAAAIKCRGLTGRAPTGSVEEIRRFAASAAIREE